MANVLNTLNLIQVKGGVNIKQGDSRSELEYELGYNDNSDTMNDLNLDGKEAKIRLYNKIKNTKWDTSSIVKGNRVSFTIDEPLGIGVYVIDIEVDGHVFPSNSEMFVRIHEGYQSYMDGKEALVAVATAKNIADEAIRLAVLNNAEKIRGPKGDTGLRGLTGKTGPQGIPGEASKVISSKYDSDGNTVITFNNNSPTVTIQRGKQGLKGDTGNPVNVASISKSGTTNTVKFTDGKTLQVKDGEGVTVSSSRFLTNGDTELTFSDGFKAIIKKGVDGTVDFNKLTEEQKQSLVVPVVDDLTSGGSDKALSAEQGKKLFNIIGKYHPDAVPTKIMTAVIDQENSNPLTCITYEDDAKMMEKGSPEWDDFFQSQLVLFKDGKEVRELEDNELNDLKPEDGDVMVRFPRKGLKIKTVGEKVYVSMTNKTNDPNFKYYAHSRGDSPRDAFYLGAYLGFEESGKLRSIKGKVPSANKTIEAFRALAEANGAGYEQLAFYQWTFLQAMYVLKYGNLDSQTALGKGPNNTSAESTGQTNGKGIDFGSARNHTKVRFQFIEDLYGYKNQFCDGFKVENGKMWIGTDKFSDNKTNYQGYECFGYNGYPKKIIGNTEQGFVIKEKDGSESTYYSDFQNIDLSKGSFSMVGGASYLDGALGVFYIITSISTLKNVSTRLMFL